MATPDAKHDEHAVPPPGMSPTQRDLLKIETEHFYQAELANEQRASWLLALSSVLLLAVLEHLTQRPPQPAFAVLGLSSIVLLLTVLSSTWSIWPLGGQEGHLWKPWKRSRWSGDMHPLRQRRLNTTC